jgi:hypothetical protein
MQTVARREMRENECDKPVDHFLINCQINDLRGSARRGGSGAQRML